MKTLKLKNETYQLRLTTKGCVAIESRIGQNPLNVFMQANDSRMPKMGDLMIILHECLNSMNHGIKMEDVYEIYDKYCEEGGDFMSLIELLVGVFEDAGFIPKDTELKKLTREGAGPSSLAELIEEQLLPTALRAGINLFEFWEMTLKEIRIVVDNFILEKENETKLTKIKLYNQAYLNTLMIGKMIGGKTIPQLEEVFPDLTGINQDKQEEKTDNSWIIIKERMIDFANEANKRRNK